MSCNTPLSRKIGAVTCAFAALMMVAYPLAGQEKEGTGDDMPEQAQAAAAVAMELEADREGDLSLVTQPLYLVTYMKSRASGAIRSATTVSVTNLTTQVLARCWVKVSWFRGLTSNNIPRCTTQLVLAPNYTADFCSRPLPSAITTCNSRCNPPLTFDEGRAIVSSNCPIGVGSSVYYLTERDAQISAITNPKIVRFAGGTAGD